MRITSSIKLNLKNKEVAAKVDKAEKNSLKDTVVAIANDAIKESPWLTGHNRRSIAYAVGSATVKTGSPIGGKQPFNDYNLNLKPSQGAIYSTSGYGGWLEVGTETMDPQPYIKPAYDKNIHLLTEGIKAKLK